MSRAYNTYWVKTVIEVTNLSVVVESRYFIHEIERKLAAIYSYAQSLDRTSAHRDKRATTHGYITVQLVNITREWTVSPVWVDIIYFVVQYYGNVPVYFSSVETVRLMKLVPAQQLALSMGYIVVIDAEPYIPVAGSKLWIIGAVIGAIVGFLLLLWFIGCLYYTLTRPRWRKIACNRTTQTQQQSGNTETLAVIDEGIQTVVEPSQARRHARKKSMQNEEINTVVVKLPDNDIKSPSQPNTRKIKRKRKNRKLELAPTEASIDSDLQKQLSHRSNVRHMPLYIASPWQHDNVSNPYDVADTATDIVNKLQQQQHNITFQGRRQTPPHTLSLPRRPALLPGEVSTTLMEFEDQLTHDTAFQPVTSTTDDQLYQLIVRLDPLRQTCNLLVNEPSHHNDHMASTDSAHPACRSCDQSVSQSESPCCSGDVEPIREAILREFKLLQSNTLHHVQ